MFKKLYEIIDFEVQVQELSEREYEFLVDGEFVCKLTYGDDETVPEEIDEETAEALAVELASTKVEILEVE